jgi:Transposase, Mutator family
VKAIGVCFPASIRIRCWFHRLANIRAKLPDESATEVMAHLYAVRDAPTLDAARAAADRLINTYRREYPAAVGCFEDDLDALLHIHRVPVRHRIRVRTTNLAERSLRDAGGDAGAPVAAGCEEARVVQAGHKFAPGSGDVVDVPAGCGGPPAERVAGQGRGHDVEGGFAVGRVAEQR